MDRKVIASMSMDEAQDALNRLNLLKAMLENKLQLTK